MFDKIRNQFPTDRFLSAHITGGGISFFDKLISPGGSSRFFYKGVIPYGIGSGPNIRGVKAVSIEMAMELAKDAYWECLGHSVGIGATFSLCKDGEREDRINHGWVCIHLGKPAYYYHIVFDKAVLNTRAKQEDAAADIIAQIIVKHVIDNNHVVVYDGATIE